MKIYDKGEIKVDLALLNGLKRELGKKASLNID